MIYQRPRHVASRLQIAHLLVGQQLIDRLPPEVTVREIRGGDSARARFVELQGNLIAIVGEDGLRNWITARGAVWVQQPLDEPVPIIIRILNYLIRRLASIRCIGSKMVDIGQPVAVVPGVGGDVAVAGVQRAA